MASSSTNYPLLRKTAFSYPIIDNHAHNLLRDTHRSTVALDGLTSEASNGALQDAKNSVAAFRAFNQLAQLYQCEPTLEAIKKARDAFPYEELCKTNMKPTGISMLLLDDGMDKIEELCHDYKWHDRLTSAPTKRIVRVETVAQNLIKSLSAQGKAHFNIFSSEFEKAIATYGKDSQVVAFKSVACYRTGLDITKPSIKEAESDFINIISSLKPNSQLRLASKSLNDYIVRLVLKIAGECGKPVQFHTGLGDNDITLSKSSPSLMQATIEEFTNTTFILLHSSYPNTRDAGYLASVYKNAYLDFGEVFPMVSRDGQLSIIRQMFELTPTTKILWSTDGHWWPESYYLAVIQAREALYKILSEYISNGDMTEKQAVETIENIFFHNSNRVYKLGLAPQATTNNLSLSTLTPTPSAQITLDALAASGIKFVRIHWVDYAYTVRFRLLPVKFLQQMTKPGFLTAKVTYAFVGDMVPSRGYGAVGEWFLSLDLNSIKTITYAPTHAFAMGTMEEKELDSAGRVVEVSVCPRNVLKHVLREAKKEGVNYLIGFEIEIVLLDAQDLSFVNEARWCAADKMPCGSRIVKALDEIMEASLDGPGIEVYQYHGEAALGQYEIVTGPLPPLEAVDTLILTREIISNYAQKHGMKMTLTPKPVGFQCGTGAHMHMSVSSPTGLGKEACKSAPFSDLEGWFLQGVLTHLPALCAFMLPSPASYERLTDFTWAGGTYVSWGRDNKDSAIRLCGSPKSGWNFEVKPMDGTGNPYLSTAAILYSGLLGIKQKAKLTIGDAQQVAASMTEKERAAFGINKKLAKSLDEAIELLKKDHELVKGLGEDLVDKYILGIEVRFLVSLRVYILRTIYTAAEGYIRKDVRRRAKKVDDYLLLVVLVFSEYI
ncbi:hypothetical protein Clacol_004070 [Clathrus columnatus]|uniref:Glutamine synthetase n=1 Tax=Clathrus columnatus TaxID=1419009 RepID=A0AAV5ABJ3_9AGAM|nr:hypothetical protein Clacol_004070 [Clathrus columnatus]